MTVRLPKMWNVPHALATAMVGSAEQRAVCREGHVVLALCPADVSTLALFWRSPQGEWRSTLPGKAVFSLGSLIAGYTQLADGIAADLERANVARRFFEVLKALRPLAVRAEQFAQALEAAAFETPDAIALLNAATAASGVARRLRLLVVKAEDGRAFDLAQLNEDQADISNQMVVSSQRLNFLIAMLLPMTAFASMLGMNVANGFDGKGGSPFLFWMIVVGSFVVGAILSIFVGRMPRQLRRESHLEKLIADLESRRS